MSLRHGFVFIFIDCIELIDEEELLLLRIKLGIWEFCSFSSVSDESELALETDAQGLGTNFRFA
jgi:hypothetical protein